MELQVSDYSTELRDVTLARRQKAVNPVNSELLSMSGPLTNATVSSRREPTMLSTPLTALVITLLSLTFALSANAAEVTLTLPDGFTASVFHPGVGKGARHLAIRDNGDVLVSRQDGVRLALRDNNNDGSANRILERQLAITSGLQLHQDYLYFSDNVSVSRLKLDDGILPDENAQTIVSSFLEQGPHATKDIAISPAGELFVNVGAPSNACQETDREAQSAEMPAEEFHRAVPDADFGWPYTFVDPASGIRLLAPEYGGDGKTPAAENAYQRPLHAYPAHWAPNDLTFYTGGNFPARYQGGAFIAWRGSWNRSPAPQEGYRVTFQPMTGGTPNGEPEDFMLGFAGSQPINRSSDARYWPGGLALDKAGRLYVAETETGRIWQVAYGARP